MSNYDAWKTNPQDFYKENTMEDKLKFLVHFAILAPSSHNSQPWKFRIEKNVITIIPNFKMALPHSDPNNRQLYISLGCALANMLIAADYYGIQSKVEYVIEHHMLCIKVFCGESSGSYRERTGHLIFSIPKRVTNRGKYLTQIPDKNFLAKVEKLSAPDIKIHIVDEMPWRSEIADIVVRAGIAAMDDKKFREELSQYVKSNITKSPVGMPAFGMGIPTPISLIAPLLVKKFNMNKKTKKKDEELLKKFTPVFCIISTRYDNLESWVRAGQWYEEIALMAKRQGLVTAPMAAIIQVGNFYKELQKVLGDSFRPEVFFRLGCGIKKFRHSPRLSFKDVIE